MGNYKILATLSVNGSFTRAFFPVLDTGAGSNLIRRDAIPAAWLPAIRLGRGPTIRDANGNLLQTSAAITLTVQSADLMVPCDFLVCNTLSVPSLLGCEFITPFVDAIRPGKRRVHLMDHAGKPKGVTAILQDLTIYSTEVNLAAAYEPQGTGSLRLARRTVFGPMSDTIVPVNCVVSGLARLQSNPR